jgi:glucosamine--fructose-6-phosphate aminotransferase (isomerizing)
VGRPSIEELAPAIRAHGARLETLGEDGLLSLGGRPLADTAVADRMLPLIEILPFQLLCRETALRLGRDPDRPPGLTKVTLTR